MYDETETDSDRHGSNSIFDMEVSSYHRILLDKFINDERDLWSGVSSWHSVHDERCRFEYGWHCVSRNEGPKVRSQGVNPKCR